MHLAYYYQRDAMAKLLEENRFNDKLKIQRNERGLLPADMNHRQDAIDAFEERANLKRSPNEDVSIDGQRIMSSATLKNLVRNKAKPSAGNLNMIENDEFDIHPDYIFLIKGSWAPVIISELMMLNLKVTEIISNLFFFISDNKYRSRKS